jgi:putative ABC transport system ATP-binding protein
VFRLEDVAKAYQTRAGQVKALAGVNLHIDQGEFVVISGPSGSGKTTLLMTVAAMLRPTSGVVRVDDRDVYAMSVRQRARFRADTIGFVFQMFHLVPYLSVLDNVLLARGAVTRNGQKTRARELLEQLGLQHRLGHRPGELSAGEKQRTAVARAMLNEPKLILADEPTGNLDPENAEAVLKHLKDYQEAGGTVMVATHGPTAVRFATRTVYLRDGAIETPK